MTESVRGPQSNGPVPGGPERGACVEIAARAQSDFDAPDAAAWRDVPALAIAHFHPNGSDHRPLTRVRLVHHGDALRVRFDVQDRYVLARHTRPQAMVCEDSCVEAFLRPRRDGPYLNFEFNCCGVVHCHCVYDWRRGPNGLARSTPLGASDLQAIVIRSSLSGRIWPERAEPVGWNLEALIPTAVIERWAGPIGPLAGQEMTANFYKCADRSSHPHWGSWSPIGDALNFHSPERFGTLRFV